MFCMNIIFDDFTAWTNKIKQRIQSHVKLVSLGSFFSTIDQWKLLKKTANMGIQNQQQILRTLEGPKLTGYLNCVWVEGSVSSGGVIDDKMADTAREIVGGRSLASLALRWLWTSLQVLLLMKLAAKWREELVLIQSTLWFRLEGERGGNWLASLSVHFSEFSSSFKVRVSSYKKYFQFWLFEQTAEQMKIMNVFKDIYKYL